MQKTDFSKHCFAYEHFQKRRTFFIITHMPQSALYSTVLVRCLYSAYTVLIQCLYSACTVLVRCIYSACTVYPGICREFLVWCKLFAVVWPNIFNTAYMIIKSVSSPLLNNNNVRVKIIITSSSK